ncbi:hypothetical protein SNEBB_004433 [Seison nebaliae]|nr:hypothetical protein SNEBB_004433 [Seison nebaliae]
MDVRQFNFCQHFPKRFINLTRFTHHIPVIDCSFLHFNFEKIQSIAQLQTIQVQMELLYSEIDEECANRFNHFMNLLSQRTTACHIDFSIRHNSCNECLIKYKIWLCSLHLQYVNQGNLDDYDSLQLLSHITHYFFYRNSSFSIPILPPCPILCANVETYCPYMKPEFSERFGGLQLFVCNEDEIDKNEEEWNLWRKEEIVLNPLYDTTLVFGEKDGGRDGGMKEKMKIDEKNKLCFIHH